ncbi:MAG TPA: NADH-quinone oxidoreductase subunit NuoH [Candidatus Polarisedimenticolia bacterium]|nr:NADH-quinone oxidoreductase subunit NuoH [Candidatus Polarisedimenticolia bacterium]
MDPALLQQVVEAGTKVALVVGMVMGAVTYMTWVERRVSAWIQDRIGPNRVGPAGLLQPIADGIKFLFKEDIVPPHVFKPLYILAPALSFVPALLGSAVVPFGDSIHLFGRDIPLRVADLNVGILFIFALSAMGVYGIALAGWSSNNKYSLMGGLRSSAQLISYELAMSLSVVGVLMAAGSLRLNEIVMAQGELWRWNVFTQPFGALIFMTAALAETNRLPFDLPECETELVAGYHTEYSSMKFAMFMMAEYANMVTASALMVTLFFGGWQVPGLASLRLPALAVSLIQVAAFCLKVGFFLFLYVWVRWTLPRFRFDQLMDLGWKVLFPLALVNIFWVSWLILKGWI